MRYLVRARVKPGSEQTLLEAIDRRTLGHGSVAEGEYLRNMEQARLGADGMAAGLRSAIVRLPYRKSGPIGRSIWSWSKSRMRMTASGAGTTMDRSHGRATTVIAPSVWSANWQRTAIHSSRPSTAADGPRSAAATGSAPGLS
jgi:hypothetical protein